MGVVRISVLIVVLLTFVSPRTAYALPSESYAHQHRAECATAWAEKTSERDLCGSRQFCTVHRNDDRISGFVCDPYVSKADRKLDSITITQAWLATARDLNALEMLARCQPYILPTDRGVLRKNETGFGDILPDRMKIGRLGLCAAISFGPFPTTIVKVGIGAAGQGWMEVTWNRNRTGARETHILRLNPAEIDHLLVAVTRSDFWRLPHRGGHLGAADGEMATVNVAVAGWTNHVTDAVGDPDAADVSILVNTLSEIIGKHWHDVPGAGVWP
jgi:hypothetical protein